MDYILSMMIVMYDGDEDEGPPVQQNIPEASLPSNSNERQEPVPDWCRCGRCFIMPQEIETSSVNTRSVLQT
jgi:hypothetical protein